MRFGDASRRGEGAETAGEEEAAISSQLAVAGTDLVTSSFDACESIPQSAFSSRAFRDRSRVEERDLEQGVESRRGHGRVWSGDFSDSNFDRACRLGSERDGAKKTSSTTFGGAHTRATCFEAVAKLEPIARRVFVAFEG